MASSLSVRKGETLGVVANPVPGKTTLGLALLRLISSDGPIVFLGSNIRPALQGDAAVPARHADRVPGSVRALSPRMSVGTSLPSSACISPAFGTGARDRVIKALRDVGMDPATRFRYPHEFSAASASASSGCPRRGAGTEFVVLDEPTSRSNMLFQRVCVDLLRELQRKLT